jgi:hypothetical protein
LFSITVALITSGSGYDSYFELVIISDYIEGFGKDSGFYYYYYIVITLGLLLLITASCCAYGLAENKLPEVDVELRLFVISYTTTLLLLRGLGGSIDAVALFY